MTTPHSQDTVMMQIGLFDYAKRLKRIDKSGDPLAKINKAVDWEIFRPQLEQARKKGRKSNAGAKGFDNVMMFKILVLQSLYNLSDEAMEYQILDRYSFTRFLDLHEGSKVPDATTIWRFREDLAKADIIESLFEQFDQFLHSGGFVAKKGQIVDASIIKVPTQRNNRDENKQIKQGDIPEDWSEKKKSQKDTDARWTRKNGNNFFGYKNHISVDVKYKLIRRYKVTTAEVHDTNVFEELLDNKNTSRDVWADAAYRNKERVENLQAAGYREHIQRRGCRHQKLTEWEKKGNHSRAKTRVRVEHVFGIQAQKAGNTIIRTIGAIRAKVKIGLRNLAYNIDRYGSLLLAQG
jgi:IS5 family transposase